MRILDIYGTDAAHNNAVYAQKHGITSGMGSLNMNLKQFYTFYREYLMGSHRFLKLPACLLS